MSNLRDNKTEEEWDRLVEEAEAAAANDKAKEQAVKDMQLQKNFNEWKKSEEYERWYSKYKKEDE